MNHDDNSSSDPPSSVRARELYERLAASMDRVRAVRSTLSTIASLTPHTDEIARSQAAEGIWRTVEDAVAQLEQASTLLTDQLPPLQTAYAPKNNGTPQNGLSRSSYDLETLIVEQRAALLVLNKQISDTLSIVQTQAPKAEQRSYGAVEIQDVSEFLQDSPIASIPINASYYQRILEAAHSPEGHKRPMGSILIEAGLITARQLSNALQHQNEGRKRPLGTLLVDLGYTTDTAIAQTIAAQLALPFVTLAQETVHDDALYAIPLHMARRHSCFPVSASEGSLYVAMANPLDLIALEDLRLASGKHVRPCVASREEIAWHIDKHYAGSAF